MAPSQVLCSLHTHSLMHLSSVLCADPPAVAGPPVTQILSLFPPATAWSLKQSFPSSSTLLHCFYTRWVSFCPDSPQHWHHRHPGLCSREPLVISGCSDSLPAWLICPASCHISLQVTGQDSPQPFLPPLLQLRYNNLMLEPNIPIQLSVCPPNKHVLSTNWVPCWRHRPHSAGYILVELSPQ